MIATTNLATPADLFAALGEREDPTDLRAIRVLASASDVVRGALGWDPAYAANHALYVDGSGTDTLVLPVRALSGTITITVDPDTSWAATPTDVVADRGAGVLYARGGDPAYPYGVWPLGRRNVRVTTGHGYVLPGDDPVAGVEPLPDAIREATVEIAAALYGLEGGDGDVVSETMGSYSYTREPNATDERAVADRLLRYRATDVA